MQVLERSYLETVAGFQDHETVVSLSDAASGLRGFIAIHDTTLGPALGGCRMWNYADDQMALTDALRLSAGMTAKNALAGLDFGGGKAVVIGDPRRDKSPALFAALGRAIEELDGSYITAEDVGVTPADMDHVATRTAHVRGTSASPVSDPSPFTALGVFHGLLAAVTARFGSTGLAGVRVAVKGLGSVGYRLAEKLHAAGAILVVADIDDEAVKQAVATFSAGVIAPDEAHAADVDVFAPCALGGGLNLKTIPQIRAAVIAGAANNQLATADDAIGLHRRGILYAPDFAINAGGVIALAFAAPGAVQHKIVTKTETIGATLSAIFARARAENCPTARIAEEIAGERILAARARSAA